MDPTLYANRRKTVLDALPSPGAAVLFSGKAPVRSEDESYPFSVNRNFYYLTGADRENQILLLTKDREGKTAESLFIEPFDKTMAKWVGGRMLPEEATAVTGIKTIRMTADFPSALHGVISAPAAGEFPLWLDLKRGGPEDAKSPGGGLAEKIRRDYPAVRIYDLYPRLAGMRMCKGEEELALMRRAQDDTNAAIRELLGYARPGMNEGELEGAFDLALRKRGVREHAFPSIFAGGRRATTLHYGENCQPVEDGELLLIDLGSAYGHYCADISRTFPINGKFSPRQAELYNLVLEAQELVIGQAAPGKTLKELNQLVIDLYEKRIAQLGLKGKVSDYYYHGVSHHLGLDTHDVSAPGRQKLEPGMVITVEPGIYIEEEGIGIRIENDVLITETGAEDLSREIPKTVAEIEALMQHSLSMESL